MLVAADFLSKANAFLQFRGKKTGLGRKLLDTSTIEVVWAQLCAFLFMNGY